jgi:hypothetical protein
MLYTPNITTGIITTLTTNQDLTIDPNGTGRVLITGNTSINGATAVTGNLSSTGNLTANNIALTATTGLITNGNSSVRITANGSIGLTVRSTPDVVLVTTAGANIAGNINTTGNIYQNGVLTPTLIQMLTYNLAF